MFAAEMRNRWSRRGGRAARALAVAALVAGSGCGNVTPDKVTDGGGEPAPLTAQQGCDMEAQAVCSALNGCAHFWVQLLYGDQQTCVMRMSLSCMNDQMVNGTTRTPDDMATCAQAVASASCPDLIASKLPSACQIKPGMLMNGIACGSDWQCQSTYCNTNGQACGACGPRAGAGGSCTSDDGCTTGLVCANNTCVMPGLQGAACAPDKQPCRSDLYCNGMSVCAPHVGVNGSCADSSAACDITQGLACDTLRANPVCKTVGVAQGGAACGNVNSTLTLCVALDACPGATLTQPGVCASPAGDGQACGNSNSGHNCIAPANCVNGVCRLPSATSCM
jgi:hypothetical protein